MPENTYPRTGVDGPLLLLAITSNEESLSHFREIVAGSKWKLTSACGCAEARQIFEKERIPVIVTDTALSDGHWRDLLETCAKLPESPLLIVTSLHADEFLWAEVLNLGGYDVLMQPFDRAEVTRVIDLAYAQWTRRNTRRTASKESAADTVGLPASA